MKATNHLGSLFFLLLLATLSFDGSAVDRLFFYFKNKIKKPAERECCCVNLNQKRGAILPVIMCILSRWHHASADPLISLLCFVSLCTQCNYHLRVGFLLCLNENYTRHQIRLCLLTRSSLVSLSFLVIISFLKRKLGSIFEMNSSSLVSIVDTVVVVNSAISTERKAWTKFGRERVWDTCVR